MRRTGVAPEFRVIRNTPARGSDQEDASSGFAEAGLDGDADITAARVKPEERGEDGPDAPGGER